MRTSTRRRIRYSLAIMVPALAVTGGIVAAASGAPTVDPLAHTIISTPAVPAPTAVNATTATAPIVHKTVTVPSKPKSSVATQKVVRVASSVPAEKDETPVVSGPMQDDETGTHPVATTPSNSDSPTLGPATTTPIESGTPGGVILGSAH